MPSNETVFCCAYCGSRYYRSEMRVDMAGNLACPKDYGGDVVEISEENAAGAQMPIITADVQEGGPFDPAVAETPPARVFPDGVVGF